MKIKKQSDLDNIKNEYKKDLELRLTEGKTGLGSIKNREVLVCIGGGCLASGSEKIVTAFEEGFKKHNLQDKAKVVGTGCMGPCSVGPVMRIAPDDVFYQNVSEKDVDEIIVQHLIEGRVVERLLRKEIKNGEEKAEAHCKDIEYFKLQKKIALQNCGVINPLSIEEYIAMDGYQGLSKALSTYSQDTVIAEMKKSGLRGRGGGGFSTGLKWEFAAKAKGSNKNVVCNADEGDPGAFMDRGVLEGDPHSVIEGMAIAGYAISSNRGYVYVRAEYPLAVERLQKAIDDARKYGLLGENILGTNFSFDLEIRMGSGAFVCGEETALMNSIEGKRGEPRPRPPFPAIKGLWDAPTLLNNVETYASVAKIILKGSDWYGSFGTAKSKGTKVFALGGAINNCGLVEVPIGLPLGELIYDIGGGIPKGKKFKAAQIGGPSGGCIPTEHLNVKLDYESLVELGAIMGSGGLIVMDENSCMVDVARFFMEFVQEESCGKCTPCRVGTKRLLEILDRICSGEGEEGDVERLIELGTSIQKTALCGLGKTAANPVLSTIRYFRHEYDEHIREKKCSAGVCFGLTRASCQSACPAGVDIPGFVSLVKEKCYNDALKLHRNRNPFAAVCSRVCFHPCETKCRREMLDSPVSVREIKRFMADQEKANDLQLPEIRESKNNSKRKIAVIGAGPAGLSCAYFLARLGYRPDVFESENVAGGMMTQAIPQYRLPRDVLNKEITMIQEMGVKLHTNKKLGRDFTLQSLREESYEAIFMGIGAPQSVSMNIEGSNLKGVTYALDFLRSYNLNQNPNQKMEIGQEVVVIGGGNAAIDSARVAKRLGAKNVTVVYRRSKEDMPAYEQEIHDAIEEGIHIRTMVAPIEIISKSMSVGRGSAVSGVRCSIMESAEFDSSGRKGHKETSEKVVINADQVIVAISQRLDSKELLSEYSDKVNVNRSGFIRVDKTSQKTSVDWLFSGGDAVRGPASVVEAIADGERAAVAIDSYINSNAKGKSDPFWRVEKKNNVSFDPDADPILRDRVESPKLPLEKRNKSFAEVELCYSESVALEQSERCLRCDYGKELKGKA
ncbi:MAG: NADH-quinone oxidoreductase subunit NuoF [Oligoflexia bacterium]|nr:NADH-quinone oxidoreductase subunit NuoF [Oligoflexia bacterium]